MWAARERRRRAPLQAQWFRGPAQPTASTVKCEDLKHDPKPQEHRDEPLVAGDHFCLPHDLARAALLRHRLAKDLPSAAVKLVVGESGALLARHDRMEYLAALRDALLGDGAAVFSAHENEEWGSHG